MESGLWESVIEITGSTGAGLHGRRRRRKIDQLIDHLRIPSTCIGQTESRVYPLDVIISCAVS